MKVFVTGGGGFLGLAIVKKLLQAGHEVVTYSRQTYESLDKLGVLHHEGPLADYLRLKAAMKDCQAVFHVAAKVGMWGHYKSFYETNVTGTKHILRACLELKIPYLIYTSSPSVVYAGNTEGKDERLPYPKKFDAFYPETKAIAEEAVLEANGPNLITCALRPHLVWGPGDQHLLPRLIEKHRNGQLRLLGKANYLIDNTYVDNAAHAHLLALNAMQKYHAPVAGKAYFLSQDAPITIREFINRLLNTGGLPPVQKSINPQIARFAGWIAEHAYRLLDIQTEPPVTLFLAKQLSSSHWYDISAAKRDLGYTPEVSIDEGMKRLKEWGTGRTT